jgi:HSP20 family protein
MSLIKYNSHPTRNLFDQFFNSNIGDFVGNDFFKNQPSVNVIEADNAFRVELAAPGLNKDDFEVQIEKDQLIISVEKEHESNEEGEKFTRREFGYQKFKRSFNLGDQINMEAIEATYDNGILTINLPKKEEAQVIKRNIEIS